MTRRRGFLPVFGALLSATMKVACSMSAITAAFAQDRRGADLVHAFVRAVKPA